MRFSTNYRILVTLRTTFLISLLVLCSCKKDKLEGDSAILIGNWNWTYSSKIEYTCNPPTYSSTLNPTTEGSSYSITLLEKGKVEFYRNDELLKSGRINLGFKENPNTTSIYPYVFSISYGKESDDLIYGLVNDTEMLINEGFPFKDENCIDYVNHLIRE